MRNTCTSFITCGLLLFTAFAFAQENAESKNSIDEQFTDLLENSNNYKQYEVVKKTKLIELQKNTRAKISGLENRIVVSENNIKDQKKEIDRLNAELAETTGNLQDAAQAKNEISFFGLPTNKTTYRIITWGILLILLVALAIFIYKFKNSHIQTKEAKKNLQETEDEFEEYRKKALEKQQKLGRSLQDERNKLLRQREKGTP